LGYFRHLDNFHQYNSDNYPDFLLDAADFEVSDEERVEEEEEEGEEEERKREKRYEEKDWVQFCY